MNILLYMYLQKFFVLHICVFFLKIFFAFEGFLVEVLYGLEAYISTVLIV